MFVLFCFFVRCVFVCLFLVFFCCFVVFVGFVLFCFDFCYDLLFFGGWGGGLEEGIGSN